MVRALLRRPRKSTFDLIASCLACSVLRALTFQHNLHEHRALTSLRQSRGCRRAGGTSSSSARAILNSSRSREKTGMVRMASRKRSSSDDELFTGNLKMNRFAFIIIATVISQNELVPNIFGARPTERHHSSPWKRAPTDWQTTRIDSLNEARLCVSRVVI